jgi:hypothetical protein
VGRSELGGSGPAASNQAGSDIDDSYAQESAGESPDIDAGGGASTFGAGGAAGAVGDPGYSGAEQVDRPGDYGRTEPTGGDQPQPTFGGPAFGGSSGGSGTYGDFRSPESGQAGEESGSQFGSSYGGNQEESAS